MEDVRAQTYRVVCRPLLFLGLRHSWFVRDTLFRLQYVDYPEVWSGGEGSKFLPGITNSASSCSHCTMPCSSDITQKRNAAIRSNSMAARGISLSKNFNNNAVVVFGSGGGF